MLLTIFTQTGEDITDGLGHYVPTSEVARVEAELRADGFIVVCEGVR